MTGLVVFAHGSKLEAANEAVRAVSASLAATGDRVVETAFLELGEPDLPGAVRRLVARGADRIVVIPYFLTLGRHVAQDLPRIVREISREHASLPIEVTPPLDGHPALLDALLDRAREARV
jgi:sirohydrochlorin ferrochelatase